MITDGLIKKFTDWLERQTSYPDLSAMTKLKQLGMLRSSSFNTFDIDGVIYINKDVGGVYPGPNDVIITGRSVEEAPETYKMLEARGIFNTVFFQDVKYEDKTRQSSGAHKATIINMFRENGFNLGVHFEDDEIQAIIIRARCPGHTVVLLEHSLTNKENQRHIE